MIVYDKIEQRSEEWHELKHGKIGGTLSKGLFVKSDTLLNEILSQKLEDYEPQDSYISSDMQRGIDLEPFALEALSKEIFVKFKQVGFLQNTAIPLLGISPDGISEDETINVRDLKSILKRFAMMRYQMTIFTRCFTLLQSIQS